MKKICVFASGEGTNAGNIIRYFQEKGGGAVDLVVTNKPDAGVIARAEQLGVEVLICHSGEFLTGDVLAGQLLQKGIDLIVLAGFMRLIPKSLIDAFPGKIVNIHPALLPKFGGKGMYGIHVHQAVIEAGEKESGITIHYVNEQYDKGAIISQERCPISIDERPETLEKKIHLLEHKYYPEVIAGIVKSLELHPG